MLESKLRLLGVVLCGGHSRRMGCDKASLLTRSGETFLEHSVRRLQDHCESVCVSATSDRVTDYPLIPDPPEAKGPMTGIHASLVHAASNGFDGCVVTPVDTPRLSSFDLKAIVDTSRREPATIVCGVSDETPFQLQPLIAVYPVHAAALLFTRLREGRYSLRDFLAEQRIRKVSLPASACQNINTPADFQQYHSQS